MEGWFKLKLEREKHLRSIQLTYLDRALDSTKDVNYRHGVLEFLEQTLGGHDPMRGWVSQQLAGVQEVIDLRRSVGEELDMVSALENQLLQEKLTIELLEESLELELEEKSRRIQALTLELANAESRTGEQKPLVAPFDRVRLIRGYRKSVLSDGPLFLEFGIPRTARCTDFAVTIHGPRHATLTTHRSYANRGIEILVPASFTQPGAYEIRLFCQNRGRVEASYELEILSH